MGRGGEDLWDDSALMNAFDDAISKYKKMHSKGHDGSGGGKVMNDEEEKISTTVEETHEAISQTDKYDKTNGELNTMTEMGDTNNLLSTNENLIEDSSNDYNRLLNKYYEVEGQRQSIVQQLHQYGNWNYQGFSGSETQVYPTQASNPAAVCSCCPYGCQIMVPQSNSLPEKTCVSALEMDPNEKETCREDGDIVRTAMGAAEKALSSLKEKASEEMNVGHSAESSSSGTDLFALMNAWYTAGFHTGKYLSEHSLTKKKTP